MNRHPREIDTAPAARGPNDATMKDEKQVTTRTRFSRRAFVAAATATLMIGSGRGRVVAQDGSADAAPGALAEVPSTGAARSGPIRAATAPNDRGAGIAVREPEAPRGVPPVAIQIEKAAVDAPIERVEITDDGEMQNPTGPWVVSWYEDLAAPGAGSNTVMAGHVDYWTTGPAVFWNLEQLVPGDTIRVIGEDDTVFAYAIEWMENFVVADLSPEDLAEIVGETEREALTLITCKLNTWDEATQEYRERFVVRAVGVD